MANTIVALGFPSAAFLWKETALGATVLSIKAAAGTMYSLEIDNTQNSQAASYLKIFDSAGAITLGTTAPDDVIRVPASTKLLISLIAARAFSAGLQLACVTAGGTAGVTAPSNSVPVQIVYA
jgi:hypothetical protein